MFKRYCSSKCAKEDEAKHRDECKAYAGNRVIDKISRKILK